jgi:hypothetical protein
MGAMPLPVPEPSDETFQWDFSFDPALLDDDAELELLLPPDTPLADQLALDDLFDQGFTWEQGVRLLLLREHLYEIPEAAERVTHDPHLGFMRWLYTHGVYSS